VWRSIRHAPEEDQLAFPYESLPPGAYYGEYALLKPPDGVRTRARLAIRLTRHSIPATFDIFVLNGNEVTKLDRGDLLSGLVTIDTPMAALNYVRAFSSPVVACLIGRPLGIEVRGRDDIDVHWVGTEEDWIAFFAKEANGSFGVVESRLLKEDPMSRPVAERVGEVFKLRRLIIQETDTDTCLFVVTEEVSKRGAYRLLSSKQVTTGSLSSVNWRIPKQE
jgi:hypothetical protein